MPRPGIQRVVAILVHPDDETLWTGGLLLSHPEWTPFILIEDLRKEIANK